MGEGVSLSLPRNGFPVARFLVVSVSVSWELGFSGGFNLPDFERLLFFFHNPFPHQAGVDLGYWEESCRRDTAFAGASVSGRRDPCYTQMSRIVDVTSWIRDMDIPGGHLNQNWIFRSPQKEKTDGGCFLPSSFRGVATAATGLPKKETNSALFTDAVSGVLVITGKTRSAVTKMVIVSLHGGNVLPEVRMVIGNGAFCAYLLETDPLGVFTSRFKGEDRSVFPNIGREVGALVLQPFRADLVFADLENSDPRNTTLKRSRQVGFRRSSSIERTSGGSYLPEYRAPVLGAIGGLCLGQHVGIEAPPTRRSSDTRTKPMPPSGKSSVLATDWMDGWRSDDESGMVFGIATTDQFGPLWSTDCLVLVWLPNFRSSVAIVCRPVGMPWPWLSSQWTSCWVHYTFPLVKGSGCVLGPQI